MLDLNPYKKGSVFFAKIPKSNDDWPLMQKNRPVVVLNEINTSYGKVFVAPITTRPNKNGVPVKLEEKVDSTILIDYAFPIFVKHLHTYLGSLSDSKMREVCYAFDIFMGNIDASEEDIKKYFPNQSIYNVDIGLTKEYNIPVSSIQSPTTHTPLPTIHTISDPIILSPNEITELHEIIENVPVNLAPEPIDKPKQNRKGRVKFPSFNTMSREELSWFANSTPEAIVAEYGCCKGTAVKKKKQATEKLKR